MIEIGLQEDASGFFDLFKVWFDHDVLTSSLKENLFCYVSDGASTMLGVRNGLERRFQTFLGRNITLFHCMIHRLHLAIRRGFDQNRLKLFEKSINSIYNFYSREYKRRTHLRNTFEDLDMVFYRLNYIHETRWIASELSALKRIKKKWKGLVKDLFSIYRDNQFDQGTRDKALEIFGVLTIISFPAILHFIMDVLDDISRFS